MANEGWVKLYRKLMENPVVTKDADHLAIWIYLLLNATHDTYPALFRGEKILLQPGQLLTGCISIANRLNVNESKVRRVLKSFENDGQIDRQISNKNSLISILNWDFYQDSDEQNDEQVTDNRRTSDGQVTTNKNVKNVINNKKEDTNVSKKKVFVPPTVDEVSLYCRERGNGIDAQSFVDFYTSKGWMIGKNHMKDWKAAVRTWERSRKNALSKNKNQFCNFEQNDVDMDALEKELLSY